jgi:hypothetical protein
MLHARRESVLCIAAVRWIAAIRCLADIRFLFARRVASTSPRVIHC